MSVAWTVFEIFIVVIEVGTVFYLLCKKFSAKYRYIVPTLLFVSASVIYLSLPLLVSLDFHIPGEIVTFVLYFLYVLLFRNGNILKKLFWVSLVYAFLFVIAYFTITTMSMISKMNSLDIITQPSRVRLITVVVGKTIQIVVFYILSINKKRDELPFGSSVIFCCALPLISLTSGILIHQIVLGDTNYYIPDMMVYIIAVSYLLMNVTMFVLYEGINKEAEKSYSLMAKNKQYEVTEQHNTQVIEIYNKMRQWKHGFMDHMQVISGILERTDPGGTGEALRYIKNMGEKIEKSSLDIDTGNLIVDAIVSTKATLAAANGINFEHDIILKSNIPIDETDLCSVLSNLLDNAIEACRKLKENKFIRLEIYGTQNQMSIKITNSSNGEYKMENGKLKTTKNGDLHGIGIGHIKTIVENHGGIFDVQPEKEKFTAYISIPFTSKSS